MPIAIVSKALDIATAEDHARVRKLLLERYEEWIASPDLYAMPIALAERLKLEEDCSTAQMHAALVVATRAVAMKFSIVGGPIIIGTEPSGEKSKPWVDDPLHSRWSVGRSG